MKKILIYSLLLLLSSCSLFTKVKHIEIDDLNFVELNYGICETEDWYFKENKNSPNGKLDFTKNFKLIEETELIPAKIGQKFGVEYVIESKETKDITLEKVWIFPETMKNENGVGFEEFRFKVDEKTNEATYSLFAIEKEYELIKGEWIFQIFYENKKLYEKKFFLE